MSGSNEAVASQLFDALGRDTETIDALGNSTKSAFDLSLIGRYAEVCALNTYGDLPLVCHVMTRVATASALMTRRPRLADAPVNIES